MIKQLLCIFAPRSLFGGTDFAFALEETQLERLVLYQRFTLQTRLGTSKCALDIDAASVEKSMMKTKNILEARGMIKIRNKL